MYSRDTAQPCPFHRFGLCELWWLVYCGHETSPPQAVPLSFQERHYAPTNHFQISSVYNRSEALQSLNLVLPALKGNSPVRGNVCNADKRVPVSGRKGGTRSVTEGFLNSTLHSSHSTL